jgi:pimeloyl-ACP methyl ester carboxylesterase
MKKVSSFIVIVSILLLLQPLSAQNLTNKPSLAGSWLGKIAVSALEIRIIFNLSIIEQDSLIATLDSPDQGVKGVKLGRVILDGNKLTIQAAAMLAEYNGTIVNDTVIEGTWMQSGQSFPVNLVKLKGEYTVTRPQEPTPPFPYISEDVTFMNDGVGIKLAGTLTYPKGDGPFPAIILITGSGGQNRNEELLGHKPFLVISDFLTRKGYAVLRYDDRGIAKSGGNYAIATSADFATDAEAAFKYLSGLSIVNNKTIGLMGHSEGSLISSIVASRNGEIAFIISLAGPGLTGENIVLSQSEVISKLSGISAGEIELNQKINKKLYRIIIKETNDQKAEEKVLATYKKELEKRKTSASDIQIAVAQLKATSGARIYPWFRYFLATDPSIFWKKVKCPVLALNGEKDTQVAWEANLNAIKEDLISGGNNSVTTVHFPGLNHLFQQCNTGLPKEYGEIEQTFSPEALEAINSWLNELYPLKKTDMIIGK